MFQTHPWAVAESRLVRQMGAGGRLRLYIKKLARGRFAALWDDSAPASLSLTRTELDLFLQGSHLVGKMALAPAPMSEKDLVIRARGDH